jgi:hypothetical protein
MKRFDCAELTEATPELILGVLPGDERAAAITHLDGCPSCQQQVSSLAGLTDQLLLLTPQAQPSAGFEQRVLASLEDKPAPVVPLARGRRHRLRTTRWAMAAAAACLLVATVVLLGGRTGSPAFASGEMRTGGGAVVGEVFVQRDRPVTMMMSLPGWTERVQSYGQPSQTYSVRIERDDGPPIIVAMTSTDGAAWITDLDVDPSAITRVAIVDGYGRTWCSAELHASAG